MKKSLFAFFTVMTLIFNISLTTYAVNENLDDNKARMNQISDKITNLDTQINEMQTNMDKLNKTIDDNNAKVKDFESQINNTEQKIDQTKKEVQESQDVLSSRLRAMYKSGSYSGADYIAYIFEANGFSDMIGRIYALNKIVDADNKMLSDLKSNMKSLQSDITSLNQKKNDVVKLNEDNKNNLVKVKESKAKLEESKSKYDDELKGVQAQIKSNEEALISSPIKTIDSSSDVSSLREAVSTLQGIVPQLTTSSVVDKAKSYISKGNDKIEKLNQPKVTPGSNNTNTTPPSGNHKTLTMEATAYTGHTITATGTKPVRDPNGISTIAVDPNVIPLGTRVYVSGYGYAIAADTGGVIKGNIIDLFMNSEAECNAFGRRQVTVKILS